MTRIAVYVYLCTLAWAMEPIRSGPRSLYIEQRRFPMGVLSGLFGGVEPKDLAQNRQSRSGVR